MTVVSLGDLVLDVVVRMRDDVARGADTPADVSLSAGGQGANVAAWVASLGGTARWLGKRATDAAGRLAAEQLGRYGVELAGPVEASGNGVIVSLADRDGERSMFPDRGIATTLEPDELQGAWLVCDHLHVSGYALLAEPVR
jgi:sugar/nucleoside kinase (ribokinase family)